MLEILKKDHDGLSKENEFKLFLTNAMKYQPDTLHIRKGNEVILGNSIDL